MQADQSQAKRLLTAGGSINNHEATDCEAPQADRPGCAALACSVPCFFLVLIYLQFASAAFAVLLVLGVNVAYQAVPTALVRFLGVQFAHTQRSQLVLDDKEEPVIFLCNHRSWGDFWIESAILGGPSFVSRRLMAIAIPCSAVWGFLGGWLWMFQRGVKHAEGSTAWMAGFYQRNYQECPGKGVVVYPEGTRTVLPQGLPLRPGGLAAAYKLGWPVQMVITTNKEHVMAEGSFSVGFGVRCVTSVSKVLKPHDFPTSDAFIEEVKAVWQATWEDAYSEPGESRATALLPGASPRPCRHSVPGHVRVNAVRLAVAVAMAVWFGFSWREAHGP